MGVHLGSDNYDMLYHGTDWIDEIYQGDTLIASMGRQTTVTGVPPLTLANAKAKPMSYGVSGNSKRTIEIDGVAYDIPDGYTMLDSLQFTATSYTAGTYINTGITPNNATKVEIKANWTYTTGSNPTLYGARTNDTYYELLTAASAAASFYQYGGQSDRIDLTSYLGTDTVYLTDNVSVYANGTLLDTASTATFTITNPIYLGCLNETGTANRFTNAKVFYCKIYQDGNTLSFAGIPAKNSSDVLGMYDFVTNTFFTNAGTGTFTAGNECPTPDGPLGVCGVGDKSANLLNANGCYIDSTTCTIPTYTFPEPIEGNIVISCDVSSDLATSMSAWNFLLYREDNTYVQVSASDCISSAGGRYSKVISNTDGPFVRTTARYYSITAGTLSNWMIEKGSTATSYEPYGYKFPLLHAQNCGMVDLGTLSWTYGGSSYNMMWATVPDKAPSVTNQYLYGYTQGSSWSTLNDMEISGISTYGRIYIRNDSYGTDTSVFKSLMSGKYLFYQRTTDTAWTAPTISNIYDDSQLYKVDTYIDTIESDGVRTNNVGIKVLNGTETITVGTVGTNYTSFNVQNIFTNAVISHAPMCSHFIGVTNTGLYNSPDSFPNRIHCQGQYSRCLLSSPNENGTTPEDFKTWLAGQYSAGTPVTIYYKLATATTETVTAPSISTVAGTNYFDFASSFLPSSMTATYVSSGIDTVSITRAQYSAITPDPDTYYIISDEGKLYKGTTQITTNPTIYAS